MIAATDGGRSIVREYQAMGMSGLAEIPLAHFGHGILNASFLDETRLSYLFRAKVGFGAELFHPVAIHGEVDGKDFRGDVEEASEGDSEVQGNGEVGQAESGVRGNYAHQFAQGDVGLVHAIEVLVAGFHQIQGKEDHVDEGIQGDDAFDVSSVAEGYPGSAVEHADEFVYVGEVMGAIDHGGAEDHHFAGGILFLPFDRGQFAGEFGFPVGMVRGVGSILAGSSRGMAEYGYCADIEKFVDIVLCGKIQKGLRPVFVVAEIFLAADSEIVFGGGAMDDELKRSAVLFQKFRARFSQVPGFADIASERRGMGLGVAMVADVDADDLVASFLQFPHQS